MPYLCVTTSLAGFVQQLAVAYVAHRYWFYVSGRVPDHKDPATVDRKIIQQYDIDISKWTRARRKKAGAARIQYLRYGRFFVILATHGQHAFFANEGKQIRDIRQYPLYFMGYAVGCRKGRDGKWHPSVRIARQLYRELKSQFAERAVKQSVDELCHALRQINYEPYAPIRNQLLAIVRTINRRRKSAGLELIPRNALWFHRSPVRPFQ